MLWNVSRKKEVVCVCWLKITNNIINQTKGSLLLWGERERELGEVDGKRGGKSRGLNQLRKAS